MTSAVSISMSKKTKERLEKACEKLGISRSELVRRALDEYLAKIGLLD